LDTSNEIWNLLEITKLFVSILTPLVVLIVGVWIKSVMLKMESKQWVNHSLMEWKIKLFEKVAPRLNDIYCYYTYIGDWKNFSPPDILQRKRELDKEIMIAQPLFSKEFISAYDDFINSCFITYRGKGKDAGMATGMESRRNISKNGWKEEWEYLFAKNITTKSDIEKQYSNLMGEFSKELNLDFHKNIS